MSARMIIRRLRAVLTRDDGITLTELVVAMGLSTLIGALTLNLILDINKSSNETIDRTIDSSSARNTIQAWTAYLRVADGPVTGVRANRFEWLAPTDILFYADINNRSMSNVDTTSAPTMMWLRLDSAGNLIEEQFASTATAGTAPAVCRTLASNVTVAYTDPTNPAVPTQLFTAYDSSGAAMSAANNGLGAAPAPSAGCRALPIVPTSQVTHPSKAAQDAQTRLQRVLSVVIEFVVSDTHNGHPLDFKSQAVLPTMGGVG